jgi:hypothetical protein
MINFMINFLQKCFLLDDGKTGENLWVFELVGFSG